MLGGMLASRFGLALVAASLLLGFACDDDAAPSAETPMLAGPFATAIPLGARDARPGLPGPLAHLPRDATAWFFWFVPGETASSLVFEIRAETTALAAGTVIHRAEEAIGEGQRQGLIAIGPRELNRGGVRRGPEGPEWLEGAYSLRVFDGDRELALLVFDVE
jgi:hypothetical protein